MRHELGLDLPERRIGLSAHHFVQLLGAGEVRHFASITVPSPDTQDPMTFDLPICKCAQLRP
ncbi:MAG: hypothetical protein FWD68_03265 [Alphaproteobacteria bacterium]|nr:hypothetical protein [Alphaproteobacteria bacterium]